MGAAKLIKMQQLNSFIYVTIILCVLGERASISASLIENVNTQEETEAKQNTSDFLFVDELGYDQNNSVNSDYQQEKSADHHFDVLIFTQQWPVTTCYHWREQDKNHECKLPTAQEFWTIHGIWPTKLGQEGPMFCNKSANFDVNQIKNIANRLEQFWPDLEGASDENNWLWAHEWLKHGTCAALLEELNNELKYFGQGLNWRDKFKISSILDASNIHPDSTNTITALNTAIVYAIGKNPSIHCLYDHKTDISYLAEIRLCFSKELELIDCDGVKWSDTVQIKYPGGVIITNCHIDKPVHYPSLVPPVQRQREQKWKFPVVNMYKLLQFIMWFTL